MPSRLEGRIRRLEQKTMTCQTCLPWRIPHQVELMNEEEDDANPMDPVPEHCPTCDQPVPQQVRRIVVAGLPDDLRQYQEEHYS